MNRKVTVSNRDLFEAADALAKLVSQGWPDARTGLQLARTFRSVRAGNEDIEQARTGLLKEYAVIAEDGGYQKDVDGTVRVSDPAKFNAQWRALLEQTAEVDVFPVNLSAVLDGKNKKCPKCNRSNVNITAIQIETLLHIGALVDDEAEKPDTKKDEAAE